VPTLTVKHKILATQLMFICQAPNIPRISKQFNLISIVMGNQIVTETEPKSMNCSRNRTERAKVSNRTAL
jgi:hypothetical protein